MVDHIGWHLLIFFNHIIYIYILDLLGPHGWLVFLSGDFIYAWGPGLFVVRASRSAPVAVGAQEYQEKEPELAAQFKRAVMDRKLPDNWTDALPKARAKTYKRERREDWRRTGLKESTSAESTSFHAVPFSCFYPTFFYCKSFS